MKRFFCIIFLAMSSCAAERTLVGTWTSGPYTFWDKCHGVLHSEIQIWEMTLSLKPDSSFNMAWCSQMVEGKKWYVMGDSLFLRVDSGSQIDRSGQLVADSFKKGSVFSYRIYRNSLEKHSHVEILQHEPNDSLFRKSTIFFKKMTRKEEL